MVTARDAREWAAEGGLTGIGNSLYTPFTGRDGDDIDWDAYRTLLRYCVGGLEHDMLWLTSGIAEWWALTIDERKQLLEVAVEESRSINPDVVIQACTAANKHEGGGGTHAPCTAARCRHRLPADAHDGGSRRRGCAALLRVHRGSD